jgi:hypothetical protein
MVVGFWALNIEAGWKMTSRRLLTSEPVRLFELRFLWLLLDAGTVVSWVFDAKRAHHTQKFQRRSL